MAKSKTQKQIDAEIAALKDVRTRVRRFSAFGTDHWRQIDLQVRVLEQHLDEDDLAAITDPDENSIAYDTIQWRDGEPVDEAPAAGWESLCSPKH